jgi:RNA-directed DNA polymerase
MTVTVRLTDAPSGRYENWNSIPWETVQQDVRRLQMRIAKAVREKKYRRAKSLQWILTHSYHAKLLAIRRVTTNKGKRTPGVDGIIWKTSRQRMLALSDLKRKGYKPQPLRRIYIPKKNGKMRPLSIPTMKDRAMQAIYKMALDPVAEATADPNSYGFRPYRRCADAQGQSYCVLARKTSPVWILEGDIKGCFDEISHEWILGNILLDKEIINKWLKAGYIDKAKLFPTRKGIPQGGIISPTLANMVLDGLEESAKKSAPAITRGTISSKIHVIRYADDFIITAESRKLLEEQVKPAVESFLRERGLSLSEEKTRITRIEYGFDFLAQNIRKYKGKFLTTPSRDSVKSFLMKIRNTIRKHRGVAASVLIGNLNPVLRGWVNYHRHIVAKETFNIVSSYIYHRLWKWMRREHPGKSKDWLVQKYWMGGKTPWTFSVKTRKKQGGCRIYELFNPCRVKIIRHTKIRGAANPYDPEYQQYFRDRRFVLQKQKLCYCA